MQTKEYGTIDVVPVEYLADLPSVDVAEVKHGKWDEIRNAYGEIEGWLCKCGRNAKAKENYCPSCGAKMDGKDLMTRNAREKKRGA